MDFQKLSIIIRLNTAAIFFQLLVMLLAATLSVVAATLVIFIHAFLILSRQILLTIIFLLIKVSSAYIQKIIKLNSSFEFTSTPINIYKHMR